jgi:hypothetical protein
MYEHGEPWYRVRAEGVGWPDVDLSCITVMSSVGRRTAEAFAWSDDTEMPSLDGRHFTAKMFCGPMQEVQVSGGRNPLTKLCRNSLPPGQADGQMSAAAPGRGRERPGEERRTAASVARFSRKGNLPGLKLGSSAESLAGGTGTW